MNKAYETNPSFHVKQGTRGKVQFKIFLLGLTKFSFWGVKQKSGETPKSFKYYDHDCKSMYDTRGIILGFCVL